jgi:hypothetical protein
MTVCLAPTPEFSLIAEQAMPSSVTAGGGAIREK